MKVLQLFVSKRISLLMMQLLLKNQIEPNRVKHLLLNLVKVFLAIKRHLQFSIGDTGLFIINTSIYLGYFVVNLASEFISP